MTPKSLLRHKRVVSRLDELGPGTTFHRILWDDAQLEGYSKIKLKSDADIKRVVLCSGKVYYDLFEKREEAGKDDVYIIRVEQLYPFPARGLIHELQRFKNADVDLVPGRTEEHGILELYRAQSRMGSGPHWRHGQGRAICWTRGFGLDGDGATVATHQGADGPRRGCARAVMRDMRTRRSWA